MQESLAWWCKRRRRSVSDPKGCHWKVFWQLLLVALLLVGGEGGGGGVEGGGGVQAWQGGLAEPSNNKNLVLGLDYNLEAWELRIFAASLRTTGCAADVVLFIGGDITPEKALLAERHAITFVPYDAESLIRSHGPVGVHRSRSLPNLQPPKPARFTLGIPNPTPQTPNPDRSPDPKPKTPNPDPKPPNQVPPVPHFSRPTAERLFPRAPHGCARRPVSARPL